MLLTETPLGTLPDIGVLESLPPKTILSPDNIIDAGLFTKRNQETLRMQGKLRYHKINGRVRYYASEFVSDFYRVTGGAPQEAA